MKKLIYLSCLIVGTVAFTNCNKQKKTPAVVVQAYVDDIANDNYDRLHDMMFCEEEIVFNEVRNNEMLKKNIGTHVSNKGGIKKAQVLTEKVASDGQSANVVVRKEYNQSEPEDIVYELVQVDNDWKIKMGPDKEVWKTQLADGTHVSFKLKDNDYKDVFKERVGDERDFVKEIETEDRHIVKVKEDGEKEVLKIKERGDKTIIKEKGDGEREKTVIKE